MADIDPIDEKGEAEVEDDDLEDVAGGLYEAPSQNGYSKEQS